MHGSLTSTELPLSIRIPLLITFGLFLFATNQTVLASLGVPINALLDPTTPPQQGYAARTRTYACYFFALATFAVVGLSLVARQALSAASLKEWSPPLLFTTYFIILFGPVRVVKLPYQEERHNFMTIIKRVAFGGISTEMQGSRFMDIIFADLLTSYARVFGDLALLVIALSSVVSAEEGTTAKDDWKWFISWAVSVPYLIRFRQCLILYRRESPRNILHLANAFKYATALPVIFTTALLPPISKTPVIQGRDLQLDELTYMPSGMSRHTWWFMSCALNSCFSIYWDIAQDWDLDLRPLLSSPIRVLLGSAPSMAVTQRAENVQYHRHPAQMRTIQTFPGFVYVICAVIDLTLRFIWTLKLIPALPPSISLALTPFELSGHVLEYVEILRRWMWIFLRIECEYARTVVKQQHQLQHHIGNNNHASVLGTTNGFTLPVYRDVEMDEYEGSTGGMLRTGSVVGSPIRQYSQGSRGALKMDQD